MALTDKLTAIADAVRGKTGGTGEMTLEQIAQAIAGIESGGGGGKTASGVYTPASDAQEIRITGLSFTPKVVYACVDLTQAEITNGTSKFAGLFICPYMKIGLRTNSQGTGLATDELIILQEELTPLADDVKLTSYGSQILISGFAYYRAAWYWRAGIPIRWTAVG